MCGKSGINSITKEERLCCNGKDVILFRITDKSGAYAEVTNYGATLVSVCVPDKDGNMENIVLNYPNISEYLTDTCYLGSTIGRFANRIANAQFKLNGKTYGLDKNDGENSNHSGYSGFHQKIFEAEIREDVLALRTHSPDGEGGFPGNMEVEIHFSFQNNILTIKYIAQSDTETVFNPTCHAYFNLSSGRKKSVLQHELKINSAEYLETDNNFLPTGKIMPVAGAFDFTQYRSIGEMATKKQDVLKGFNTCFPIPDNGKPRPMASVKELTSGRAMTVSSDMPGILLYTGDYLCGNHAPFDGLCLEAQFYPDAPNQKHFPECTIKPGTQYEHIILISFNLI